MPESYTYIASFINLIPEAIRYNLGDVLRILFAIDLTMSTIKMSAFPEFLIDYFGVKLWKTCVKYKMQYE